MKLILKLLLTSVAVMALAYLLPGITVTGFKAALIVAVVIAVLRLIVKPILVILTLPVTIFTFGLFLLVINAIIIMLADYLIGGFAVSSIWMAMLFSVLLSIFQSILFTLIKED